MNPPTVPLFESSIQPDIRVLQRNIDKIIDYLFTLEAFLRDGEPDEAVVVTGVTTDKTLAVGDTLTNTQHFLGTIVQALQAKGLV